MDERNLLTRLNYPLDKELFLGIANRLKETAKPYSDPRYPGYALDNWLIEHYTDNSINKLMKDLQIEGKPRFYWLKENTVLPEHVDNGTQCSVNIILTDDAAPVTFSGIDYYYSQALLNTTVPHSVTNGPKERILLKISIFDETYEQLSARIGYKAD